MSTVPPYRDRKLSTAQRTADLMQRMTIQEKVGQLVLADGRQDAAAQLMRSRAGAFLHVLGKTTTNVQLRLSGAKSIGARCYSAPLESIVLLKNGSVDGQPVLPLDARTRWRTSPAPRPASARNGRNGLVAACRPEAACRPPRPGCRPG
jgi:hypothetical protein